MTASRGRVVVEFSEWSSELVGVLGFSPVSAELASESKRMMDDKFQICKI